MVLDATANCHTPVTRERLFGWHAALFPTGYSGKLTSSKWATMAKCSPDTALRDITDLLARGILRKSDAGGRSTSYQLNGADDFVFRIEDHAHRLALVGHGFIMA